jgi:signal transduction histidine kinase
VVIHEAIKTGEPQVLEYLLELPAGICWFEARVASIPSEVGAKPMVVWLARDITERKRAEEAIKESQYYFENLDRISRAISQATDIDDMLFHVVQEILTIFRVDRAWFVYPCDPSSPTWSVPVEATVPEYPGLFALKTEMPGDDSTARAFELALDSDEPLVFVSTAIMEELESGALDMLAAGPSSAYKVVEFEELSDTLTKFNIKSQIAIALQPKVGRPWMLGVHQCAYFRRWSDTEVKLFREIAERVTDCLTNFVLFRQLEEDVVERKRSEEHAQRLLEQNRALTQRLFSIQEEERRHLSRELHDEFGQLLTAINLHAQAISRQCDGQAEGVRESAQVVAEGAAQVIQDIRNMIRQLRPHALDTLGLTASLEELVTQIRFQNPELNIELDLQGECAGLEETVNITLYRVVQEGITNVIKHAKADTMAISMRCRPGAKGCAKSVELLMQDNGVGVDLDDRMSGMGLMGMRERILAVGGEFYINSVDAGGVSIKVLIPLDI